MHSLSPLFGIGPVKIRSMRVTEFGTGVSGAEDKVSGTVGMAERVKRESPRVVDTSGHGSEQRINPTVTANGGASMGGKSKNKKASSRQDGFVSLFNGTDLQGWIPSNGNPNNWGVADGVLMADSSVDKGGKNYLMTERSFSNFELEFQYRLAPNSFSGFTFWATPDDTPWSLEINNGSNLRKRIKLAWPNLSHDNYFVNDARIPIELRRESEWNQMRIEVKSNFMRVFLNGVHVFERNPNKVANMPTVPATMKRRSGSIGFSNRGGTMMFRQIRIRELPEDARTTPAPGRTTAQDLFRPGSIWDGENPQGGLKVVQRQGDRFVAEFQRGDDVKQIKGTILDGKITWYARDVEVLQGERGHGTWGGIQGDKVTIHWHDRSSPDPEISYILRLRNK
jgi:hypothetical protein